MKSVSLTAIKIARIVVAAGEDPVLAHLLPPGAAAANRRLLSRAGLLPAWMQQVLASPWYRRFSGLLEHMFVPAFSAHVVLRKRYFEDQVRRALKGGASRVAVLGAGFDTMALRLAPEFPQALFLEHDAPPTLERKARALAAEKPPNLSLVARDLSTAAVQATEPADVIVAEGLLMYLKPEEVHSLLAAAAPGTRVVFSFMTGTRVSRLPGLAPLVLRLVGEPLRWICPPERLGTFLATAGLTLVDHPTPAELAERYGAPGPASDFERVAVARREK